MSMDFLTLKKRAAKILNLLDSSDNIQTGKDVDETFLGESINDYLNGIVYPKVMNFYPHYFEMTAYGNNFKATGEVDSSSTGTTLVATLPIFDSSYVDKYVYNVTDDEFATIETFNSTTTVTLDKTIGDDWDGDVIRVIDTEFGFGGDAIDLYALRWVGVKYKETDTVYRRATPQDYRYLFQTGWEAYSQGEPVYYVTRIKINGTPTDAIGILPRFEKAFPGAIQIRYLEKQSDLSDDADTPNLPSNHHEFLKWAGVKEAAIKRGESGLYQVAELQMERGLENLLKYFRVTSLDTPVKIHVPRRVSAMFLRRY